MRSKFWKRGGLISPRRGFISAPTCRKKCRIIYGRVFAEEFRAMFDSHEPILMKAQVPELGVKCPDFIYPVPFPALNTWFAPSSRGSGRTIFSSRVMEHSMTLLPYELLYHVDPRQEDHSVTQKDNDLKGFSRWLARSQASPFHPVLAEMLSAELSNVSCPGEHFLRLDSPLELLIAATQYNQKRTGRFSLGQMYIAQAPLDLLPQALQDDLPTPELVLKAGKGDVYNSSIWLGLQPTYTPWHRDPNHNLFVQLESAKVVKLLPEASGRQIFDEVQSGVWRSGTGTPNIRGTEMMLGAEAEALHARIWGPDAAISLQYRVDAGDALFIPKGWWHSLKSVGGVGELNASVNWWFR